METGVTTQLLSMGLPGVVILILLGGLVYLYKRVEKFQSELNAQQELRITDIKELAVKLGGVIERNTAVLERNTDLLEDVKIEEPATKRRVNR